MRRLKIGCGVVLALFVILVAVLMIAQSRYEKGWRHVLAFNTTNQELQVGVEYEKSYMAEKVPAHSTIGFNVHPGKARAIVLDTKEKVLRRGSQWLEIKPDGEAPDSEDLYLDALGEGNYAVVDAHIMYAGTNVLSESLNESMNKGRKYFQALLPASEIMVFDSASKAARIYPDDKLPPRAKWGEQLFAFRRVSKELHSTADIMNTVVAQLQREGSK